MKHNFQRILTVCFLFLILWVLPGQAVQAEDPAPPYHLSLPLVWRQISLAATHISPNIGRTLSVYQDPFKANILYTFTFGSGVYRSTDYGDTWLPSSKGMTYLVLQSFTTDPHTPGVLYAGTYGETNAPFNGVYKSTDYGETWFPTGAMKNIWNGVEYHNPVVYVLAVDPRNPNIVFAGTRMKLPNENWLGGGGVFRSLDGGLTWTAVNTGLPNDKLYVYDLAMNPSVPGELLVTLHGKPPGGIYSSGNYGDTWYPFFVKYDATDDGRALAYDPFDSNTVFYGAATFKGIWYRRDGDWHNPVENWTIAPHSLSMDPYHPGHVFAGACHTISETDRRCLVYRMLRSLNGGINWQEVDAGNFGYSLAFAPDQRTIVMARDFLGIARSFDDGLTWTESSHGITAYSATGLAIDPNNPQNMAITLYGEGAKVSFNGGQTWDNRMSGLKTITGLNGIAMDPHNSKVMYVTTDQSGVYASDDAGANWRELLPGYPAPTAASLAELRQSQLGVYANRPIPAMDDDLQPAPAQLDNQLQDVYDRAYGGAIAVSPFDGRVVLVAPLGRGIYRLNGGAWQPSSLTTGNAYSLWFDPATPGRVLAGVSADVGSLLVSTDNGQTWQANSSGLSGLKVLALSQNPTLPTEMLAATDSGVYLSKDGGSTWSLAGLPGQVVMGAAMYNPGSGMSYLAATADALYLSNSLPGVWSLASTTLINMGIQQLVTAPGGDAVYVLSRLGGIKRVQ